MKALYRTSRAASVSVEEASEQFLDRIRHLVKNTDKFPRVSKGQELVAGKKNAAMGIVTKLGSKDGVLVLRLDAFRSLVEPPAIANRVLGHLASSKHLLRGEDGKNTRQVSSAALGAERRRYVCLLNMG